MPGPLPSGFTFEHVVTRGPGRGRIVATVRAGHPRGITVTTHEPMTPEEAEHLIKDVRAAVRHVRNEAAHAARNP